MVDPVIQGFGAIGEAAKDPVWSEHLRKSADGILAKKSKTVEAELGKAYFEAERELVRRSVFPHEDEARRQLRDAFAESASTHPDFNLIFLPKERQFVVVFNAIIVAYAEAWRAFVGRKVIDQMIASSVAGTRWADTKIVLGGGIEFNQMRLRSLQDCVQMASEILERWYRKSTEILGDHASRDLFGRAFKPVEGRYGFLPALKSVLGATPLEVLVEEKTKRLHELETETVSQAQSIRAADEGLRRQAERLQKTVVELEDTKDKLELTARARSEFINVVSHQFRTPLSSIRWNSELMEDEIAEGNLDKRYADAVGSIRTKSVYLIETLDRVFTTLDIDTGKLVLDKKPAFLWEVVQDVYNNLEKDIKRKNIKWKFNRSKEQVIQIPMDKEKITTILKIVMGNAVNYNKDGGKIDVSIDNEEITGREYQTCTVTDEGIGIPKEDLDRIFEKFYRSKTSILKMADGTGLGMYIIRNIVEAHGGLVRVESAGKDRGTKIFLALPVGKK